MLPMLVLASLLRLNSVQLAINPDDHAQEVALLHAALDPQLLRRMQVFDTKHREWRDAKPNELWDDKTQLLIVHVWATWCAPCRDEFPMWRNLVPQIESQYPGRVRVLFVAVQSPAPDLEAFLVKHRASMPTAPLYQEPGERLSSLLRERVIDHRLQYPITLFLDPQHIVRQAFVGTLRPRRAELLDSLARLLRLLDPKPQLQSPERTP